MFFLYGFYLHFAAGIYLFTQEKIFSSFLVVLALFLVVRKYWVHTCILIHASIKLSHLFLSCHELCIFTFPKHLVWTLVLIAILRIAPLKRIRSWGCFYWCCTQWEGEYSLLCNQTTICFYWFYFVLQFLGNKPCSGPGHHFILLSKFGNFNRVRVSCFLYNFSVSFFVLFILVADSRTSQMGERQTLSLLKQKLNDRIEFIIIGARSSRTPRFQRYR